MKQEMLSELISVIMPVYNSQDFLEESIKSILNQTLQVRVTSETQTIQSSD